MSCKIERKFAAIMFTDIAGYTEQMSKDENKAFSLIQKKRELLLPLVEKYEGKLIKEIGDGTLTRYFKADNAIDCASTFQSKTNADLNVRAGIHAGEVIIDKKDVFGDVVNIASRLESIAVPGSILVSKETIDKLEMSDKVELVSLGMQSLKGVGRLIEVYAIKGENLIVPNPEDYEDTKIAVHSDKEVPSIAIIPFENKGKEEDDYFAYGISVDLISDLTSAGLIRVASKKQIDEAGNIPQDEIAKKLDVRYIANGELWRIGKMFQISVELYDIKNNSVVWSDRWQEKWDSLPKIKMNLSDGLLKTLNTKQSNKVEIISENVKAYEFYLKAKFIYLTRKDDKDINSVKELLERAIKLDDKLIEAKHMIGNIYADKGNIDRAIKIFKSLLIQCRKLNYNIGIGRCFGSIGILYGNTDNNEKYLAYSNKALQILKNINDKDGMGTALQNISIFYYNKGNYNESLKYARESMKIRRKLDDKYDISRAYNSFGMIYNEMGENNKAMYNYKKALKIAKDLEFSYLTCILLMNIGNVQLANRKFDKAIENYNRSYKISKSISSIEQIVLNLNNLASAYIYKNKFQKALTLFSESIEYSKKTGNKNHLSLGYGNSAIIYLEIGDYTQALNLFKISYKYSKQLGGMKMICFNLKSIGIVYFYKKQYNKSLQYLEKAYKTLKELEINDYEMDMFETILFMFSNYKKIGRKYNKSELIMLAEKQTKIESSHYLLLYELLNKKIYLETAYNFIKKEKDSEYFDYPIPKTITQEYNKVFKK